MTEPSLPQASPPARLLWQKAVIKAINPHTPRITSFRFTLPQPFAFVAGQHVDVRLTAPDGYQAQRSYSIASAPENFDTIELAIERLDDGEVSPFFHDVATVGDEIEIRGPIGGHFVWSVADGGPLLLLGGGSGIVPLMCMIRHRAAQCSTIPILLLYSVRTCEEAIFRDELIELQQQNNGLQLVFAVTREPTQRQGDYSRRVDAAMMSEIVVRLPAKPARVFICGSNPFVAAAAQGLIHAAIPAGLIRTERYGG